MTENEALKELNICIGNCVYLGCEAEAMHEAINALNEIRKYRSIGTIEECQDAMERQRAKKPKDISYLQNRGYYVGFCSACDRGVGSREGYCGNCGQNIDWRIL